jgi:uncharacterized protein
MIKRLVLLGAFACVLLTSHIALGRAEVPGRTNRWVNDYAGILDSETRQYLEDLCGSVQQQTPEPVEVIVAIFQNVEGWNFSDFAVQYGENWREIKKGKRDNGVILIVALNEARVTIGVGQNLSGILTSSVVSGIIKEKIIPEFSEMRYAEGIKIATEDIVQILNDADIPTGNTINAIRIALIILFISALILIFKRSTRPPA